MTIRVVPLAEVPPADIEALLDAAFGADRHTRTAYRIRAGMTCVDALSFAAMGDDVLVGSIQTWPVAVDDTPLVLVGPVAVAPARQNAGIGTVLMNALLDAAPTAPMAMIGDPDYYCRFGFTADATAGWTVPGPVERHRLLARNADGLPRDGALGPRGFARASSVA